MARGGGIYAEVKATDVFNFPVGLFHGSWRAGLDGRTRPQLLWSEKKWGGLLALSHSEHTVEGELPGLAHAKAWNVPGWLKNDGQVEDVPPYLLVARKYEGKQPSAGTIIAEQCWLEVDVFVWRWGFRLGLNPLEVVDFVGGLLTINLLGDDTPPKTADASWEEYSPQTEGEPAGPETGGP